MQGPTVMMNTGGLVSTSVINDLYRLKASFGGCSIDRYNDKVSHLNDSFISLGARDRDPGSTHGSRSAPSGQVNIT